MIWREVINQVKCLEREWRDDVPLSFRMGKKDNDREINEWYNEENWDGGLEFVREMTL